MMGINPYDEANVYPTGALKSIIIDGIKVLTIKMSILEICSIETLFKDPFSIYNSQIMAVW